MRSRALQAWAGLPPTATLGGPIGQSPLDCVRANELCAAEPGCSSSFRTLRQCLAGRDPNTLLGNKECRLALEVLRGSPLHGCRCRRRMKKELPCLQTYWSLQLGSAGGGAAYEASPYEPVSSPLSDAFSLASMVSGTDSASASRSNPCLEAAKACNLNDNCKKLRSAYISTCNAQHCNRRKCHKALRIFFDQVPSAYSYRLLFCSCKDQACAQRRRQTIVPDCSYQEKEKPNCLVLRTKCQEDPLCRSRLADFHTNCQTFLPSCSRDDYQPCLDAYTGLIGNAMEAFGNGTDLIFSRKALPPARPTLPPSLGSASSLPDGVNDSSLVDNTSVSITCTSIQKPLTTALMPEQKTLVDPKGSGHQLPFPATVSALLFLLLKMAM
ncbi:GDNF family receptor alpha-2 isoform X7 [Erythrolamprus reginae]|uniref:GDNF family receptor alpha-2 isoform X7 n=1 Tax=Erythrolamprus reginae TaxID=121349 RepID=UPI00396C32D1